MTWSDHAKVLGRVPCTVVEIDLDWIDDPAVTATNPDGSLCYRTPATTKQGDLVVTSKTRRWMTGTQRPIPTLGAIPCVNSAVIQAEEIRIGRGLGSFGQVSIDVSDFVDSDFLEDPFYSDASRAATNHKAGTYFGKLMARNPWWTNRRIRVIEGWTTDGNWHAEDAITHYFLIRDVQGPSGGRVRITAAGPLQLLNLSDTEVPAPSSGALSADLPAIATTATINPVEAAVDYGPTGYVQLGEEVMAYVRTGASLALTRAQFGTAAISHTAGDTIQECASFVNMAVTDILAQILTVYGKVDPAYLALDAWATEQTDWLALYILTGIIGKPTKILDVTQELLEAAAGLIWWDDQTGKVQFRAVRPALASLGTWTDRFHFMDPGVATNRDLSERASRTDMLISLRDPTRDSKDAASYRVRVVGQPQGEEPTEHGSEQVKVMFSRWLSNGQLSLAVRACAQSTMILRDGRQTFVVMVAAKDAARQIGDILDILTRDIVDRNGEMLKTRVIVAKREAVQSGSSYRYTLERVPFDGRFAFFTDVDCPDYDDASTRQRDPGGFFMNAAGDDFSPTDPAYLFG